MKILLSRWLLWLATALLIYSLIGTIFDINLFIKSSPLSEEKIAFIFSIIFILGRHDGMINELRREVIRLRGEVCELRGEMRKLRGLMDEVLRRLPPPTG